MSFGQIEFDALSDQKGARKYAGLDAVFVDDTLFLLDL